jgi:hypothetical protein
MKSQGSFRKAALLAFALVLTSFVAGDARTPEGYSFKIHNNTEHTITQVLVSGDGDNYEPFDIGYGIVPGATADLFWDESTNDQGCRQYFRVFYDDDSQSEAVRFDFCEQGLVLEFD